jgi:hypothetical protein
MASHQELNSRAALCRRLAAREPSGKAYWLAEAESWSRLSREPGHAIVAAGTALAGERGYATRSRHDGLAVAGDAFEQFLSLMAAADKPEPLGR